MLVEVFESGMTNLNKHLGIQSLGDIFMILAVCLMILFAILYGILLVTRSPAAKIKHCLSSCALGVLFCAGLLTIPAGLYMIGKAFFSAAFEVWE
jgi:hypothetical protein